MKRLNCLAMAFCLAIAACCGTACSNESELSKNSESKTSETEDLDSSLASSETLPLPQESNLEPSVLPQESTDAKVSPISSDDKDSSDIDTATSQFLSRYSSDDDYYFNVNFIAGENTSKESQTLTMAHNGDKSMYYLKQSDESFGMIESDGHIYALYPDEGVYYESSTDTVDRDMGLSLEQIIDSLMSDAVFVENRNGYDIYKFDSSSVYDMFQSGKSGIDGESSSPDKLYFRPDGNTMTIEARTDDGEVLDNVIEITFCDFNDGDTSMFDLSKYKSAEPAPEN